MSLYDPDHEADLRSEFAPCRSCRGTGVVRDMHGFVGGPAEESECGCLEREEEEGDPCCVRCGGVMPWASCPKGMVRCGCRAAVVERGEAA